MNYPIQKAFFTSISDTGYGICGLGWCKALQGYVILSEEHQLIYWLHIN
jgi:hypothetical protein